VTAPARDVRALRTLVLAKRVARIGAEAEAKARALLIEKLRRTIAKLESHRFDALSERSQALIEQLELALAEQGESRAATEVRLKLAEQAGHVGEQTEQDGREQDRRQHRPP
jgi:transposase